MNKKKRKEPAVHAAERVALVRTTYIFRSPPVQSGDVGCDTCFGLGWMLNRDRVARCAPCDTYEDDTAAAKAAAESLAGMYTQLAPGEELVRGYGYEPFVLHPLPSPTDACPDCNGELTSVEAGYDRYGAVSLDDKVLLIEDEGFSDDGSGPHYLLCTECPRAYALPPGTIDYR